MNASKASTSRLWTRATLRGLLLGGAALGSFSIGACFNGFDADGLPCESDSQCGPRSPCFDGYCGGVFFCDDEDFVGIDAAKVCDGEFDCEEGQDESFELCPVNECEEPATKLGYELGSSVEGPQDPSKIEVVDIMGSSTDDAVFAGKGGEWVKVGFELESSSPKEYYLGGPPPSFEGRVVVDFELGSVNGDSRDDVVLLAVSEMDAVVYVFENRAPEPPTLFGAPSVLSDIIPDIEAIEIVPHGIELGRLNNDANTDVVGVLDIGPMKGNVLVGIGDSSLSAGSYFDQPELLDLVEFSIGYDVFVDMAMADLDGNGFDDLLVSGIQGQAGKLWRLGREGAGEGEWAQVTELVVPPGDIALGRLTGAAGVGMPLGPRPDVAILTPMTGAVQSFTNMDGMLTPNPEGFTVEGNQPSGLTIADLNCDGNGDFIVNVADPASVQVYLGDGEGGVISTTPITYESDGAPGGGLGVARVNDDQTPDIFSLADGGNGLSNPQLQVLLNISED